MSDDPKWEEEWDAGFALFKKLHPYLYQVNGAVTYPKENEALLSLLEQGEIDMCPSWMDMALMQQRAGAEQIRLAPIEPAFTGSVDGMAVPSFSGNKESGTAFINYILSPAAQKILIQDMAAIPLKTEGLDPLGEEELFAVDVSSFRTQALGELADDLNQRWYKEIAGA